MTAFKICRMVLIVFYVLLLTGLALYDEDPSAERQALMVFESEDVLIPDNLWLALQIFDSQEKKDPLVYGKDLLKVYDHAVQEKNWEGLLALGQAQKHIPYPKSIDAGILRKGKLLPFVQERPGKALQLIEQNEELLSRYKTLRNFRSYVKLPSYNLWATEHGVSAMFAQRLFLIDMALHASRGEVSLALEELDRDMDFWRFVAENSQDLILREVSNSCIGLVMNLTVAMSKHCQLLPEDEQLVTRILRPFTMEELNSLRAIVGDIRGALVFMTTLVPPCKKIDMLLYKKETVLNRMLENREIDLELAALSASEFAHKVPQIYPLGPKRFDLAFLYNPLGEFLVLLPAMDPYFLKRPLPFIERTFALEGKRRVALLEIMAAKKKIASQDMPQFLEQKAATDNLANPFYDRPMSWNGETETIDFQRPSDRL